MIIISYFLKGIKDLFMNKCITIFRDNNNYYAQTIPNIVNVPNKLNNSSYIICLPSAPGIVYQTSTRIPR